jgi:hypothetical protein
MFFSFFVVNSGPRKTSNIVAYGWELRQSLATDAIQGVFPLRRTNGWHDRTQTSDQILIFNKAQILCQLTLVKNPMKGFGGRQAYRAYSQQ